MTNERTELSRRKALQRVAMVGAAAWTAPMIVSTTAHAAGSLADNICANYGKPNSLRYTYVGGDWAWDVCDGGQGGAIDGRGPDYIGSPPAPDCVHITVTQKLTGKDGGIAVIFDGLVNLNGSFTIPTSGSLRDGTPNTEWTISRCGSPSRVNTLTVHVSCSQALCVGDKHGWFLLAGYA
jgi:hypothetical protein